MHGLNSLFECYIWSLILSELVPETFPPAAVPVTEKVTVVVTAPGGEPVTGKLNDVLFVTGV